MNCSHIELITYLWEDIMEICGTCADDVKIFGRIMRNA